MKPEIVEAWLNLNYRDLHNGLNFTFIGHNTLPDRKKSNE